MKPASDKVYIAKVDADNHKDLGSKYGVTGFPSKHPKARRAPVY